MPRFRGSILIDNNAIGDAVDLNVWRGLLGAYSGQLETVKEIEEEAGSYFRSLPDSMGLMASLSRLTIHSVTDAQISEVETKIIGITLDPGERDLWAHAHDRKDTWILCGPDKASLSAAVQLGFRNRLVSLEQLLREAGLPTRGLAEHMTKAWLDKTVSEMVVAQFKL